MLVKRLPQDLNDFISLIEICAAKQIDHDTVSAKDALAKCLRLAIRVKQLDLLIWRWYDICVFLNHSSRELM